ncbi:MYB-related transcription factor [Gracilaria domingensis]|nr:MYB-related transcription factor [Gracilaria domingensis]
MTSSAAVQTDATMKITGRTVAKATRRKGRRESYTRFSASEEAHLLEGVRKYGAGKWKKILTCYEFHRKRTAVDLKDKYRNIIRAQEREKRQRLERSVAAEESNRVDHPAQLCNSCNRDGLALDMNDMRGNMNDGRVAGIGCTARCPSDDVSLNGREKRMEAPSAMKLTRLLCEPEESY